LQCRAGVRNVTRDRVGPSLPSHSAILHPKIPPASAREMLPRSNPSCAPQLTSHRIRRLDRGGAYPSESSIRVETDGRTQIERRRSPSAHYNHDWHGSPRRKTADRESKTDRAVQRVRAEVSRLLLKGKQHEHISSTAGTGSRHFLVRRSCQHLGCIRPSTEGASSSTAAAECGTAPDRRDAVVERRHGRLPVDVARLGAKRLETNVPRSSDQGSLRRVFQQRADTPHE
jgi:hypothetical protein